MSSQSLLAVRTVRPRASATAADVPVVLLHGFASSGAEDFGATGWAETFADAGRTTHILDLPGHGLSPAVRTAGDGRTSAIVAMLVSTLAELSAEPVDVVAYSLGARLAWELPRAAAGRVRRLVLGGLSPFDPFAGMDTAAIRAVVAGSATADQAADPFAAMMAALVTGPGRDTESLITLIAGLGSEPFEPSTTAPSLPTLVVAGSDDGLMAGIDEVAALLPDGSLRRVPGDHRGALDSSEFRAAALAHLG